MDKYKQDFIEFLVRSEVLTFGDFTTKSGRLTPYFINTGKYRSGAQVATLGRYYAEAICSRDDIDHDVLFGPAYKGIPLVITAAIKLHEDHGRDVAYCFNRKEAKDHGEGGILVGHELVDGDRVLIVEDVTTAGTSIRETVPILRAAAKVKLAGLIVSVDRMERGPDGQSALQAVGLEFSMPSFAIVTIEDIVEYLSGREIDGRVLLDESMLARIAAYRAEYGVPAE